MGHVTQQLHDHYRATFLAHGATRSGVDWGPKEDVARLRQDKMLALGDEAIPEATLPDVSCGYAASGAQCKREGRPVPVHIACLAHAQCRSAHESWHA
jgi:hypothetical protein